MVRNTPPDDGERSTGSTGPERELLPRMTLWEALLASTVRDEAAQLHRLGPGYGVNQLIIVGGPETESDRERARYSQYRERAEKKLRARLRAGELLATGRDSRDPFAPRRPIPADSWPHLKIDYVNSTIEVGLVQVIGVQIALAGGLHINTVFRSARLGVVDLVLSARSLDLLLSLAEGAEDGLPFVSLETLGKKHFEHATNDKALGQGIEDLRNQLGSKIGREAAVQLVSNVRGKGYRLELPPAEILIVPRSSARPHPPSDTAR